MIGESLDLLDRYCVVLTNTVHERAMQAVRRLGVLGVAGAEMLLCGPAGSLLVAVAPHGGRSQPSRSTCAVLLVGALARRQRCL